VTVPGTKPGSRRGVLIWLVISQILAVGSLIPWLGFAYYTYHLLFNGVTAAWDAIFVGFTLAYPVVVIGSAILAWLFYRAHKDRLAVIVSSIFLVGPIFFFVTVYAT